jgi:hypothetical protein
MLSVVFIWLEVRFVAAAGLPIEDYGFSENIKGAAGGLSGWP